MAKKEVIQRKDRNAPVKQTRANKTVVPRANKPATPKWNIVKSTDDFVLLKSQSLFKDDFPQFDPLKFHQALRDFPGKVIGADSPKGKSLWIYEYSMRDTRGKPRPGFEHLKAIAEAKQQILRYYQNPLGNPAPKDDSPSLKTMVQEARQKPKIVETSKKVVITHDPKEPGITYHQKQVMRDGKWVNEGRAERRGETQERKEIYKENSELAKNNKVLTDKTGKHGLEQKKQAVDRINEINQKRNLARKKVVLGFVDEKARMKAVRATHKKLILKQPSSGSTVQGKKGKLFREAYNRAIEDGLKRLRKTETKYLATRLPEKKDIIESLKETAREKANRYVDSVMKGEAPKRGLSRTGKQLYGMKGKKGQRFLREGERLSKSQYMVMSEGKRVVVYSTKERVAARKKAQAKAEARAQQRVALKAERQKRWEDSRATVKENRRRRDVARSAALRTTKRRTVTAEATAYAKRVSASSGFGRVPLKMLLAGKRGIKGTRGKMTALQSYGTGRQILSKKSGSSLHEARLTGVRNIPRSTMYPPMRHSKGKPHPIIKKMLKPVSGRLTLQNISEKMTPTKWFGGKGTMYAISQTVAAPKPVVGGRGVMFSMGIPVRFEFDVLRVMRNLNLTYPGAVKRSVVSASKVVGPKLLDLVEPYVPKDTGLLYSSATTNVDQTSGGMIDMVDNTAFPDMERYGVSISYNAPYAEIVYFGSHAHGEEYNRKHGVMEKDSRETARWIEVAFEAQQITLNSLLDIYARHVTAGLNVASSKMR